LDKNSEETFLPRELW